MADKDYKAFIVEGEVREPQIIDNISKIFFHGNYTVITLPAGENIYMLWKQLKEDDYDAHQTNLGKAVTEDVIRQMLESFDNETENGKLYISYPMVEALRDYEPGKCGSKEECFVEIQDLCNYKSDSSNRAYNPHFKEYDIDAWKDIIDVFAMKVSCLYEMPDTMEYEQYSGEVTPYAVYAMESKEAEKQKVFVLSAFPEFLLDYFGVKLWKTSVRHSKNQRDKLECFR